MKQGDNVTKTEKSIQQMETWDRKNLPSAMGAQAPAIPVERRRDKEKWFLRYLF